MKRTLRCLGIGLLILSLGAPYLVFQLDDLMNSHRKTAWNDGGEIFSDYPIIANIYSNYYLRLSSSQATAYDLTDPSVYNTEMQLQLRQAVSRYNDAIHELLTAEVIPFSYLDLADQEHFQVTFGTLSMVGEEQHGYLELQQIFYLKEEYSKMLTYTLDRGTNKITRFFINERNGSLFQELEMEALLTSYIQYLGLDGIQDWNKTAQGYESYQAKLQVYSTIKQYNNEITLEFGVCPIGQYRSNLSLTMY